MPEVEIYTDGACSGNPGAGGWGAILRCGSAEKNSPADVIRRQTTEWSLQLLLRP